ncbi:hypothetical protein Taro_042308 [Colocasia esculenta]|uniref:Uncharacterized protein n=1 Tax=Colocasia esculenta TaxID=4460 RepID=A0A843WY96_COLES|nr:hypothetical protein [Colocasia esculenta]
MSTLPTFASLKRCCGDLNFSLHDTQMKPSCPHRTTIYVRHIRVSPLILEREERERRELPQGEGWRDGEVGNGGVGGAGDGDAEKRVQVHGDRGDAAGPRVGHRHGDALLQRRLPEARRDRRPAVLALIVDGGQARQIGAGRGKPPTMYGRKSTGIYRSARAEVLFALTSNRPSSLILVEARLAQAQTGSYHHIYDTS